MVLVQFIAPTKRRAMTKARAARIFLANNGICCNCGVQIRQGDGWFVEHGQSLALGGADDDVNAKPAHTRCKAEKDATDAAAKAKRDRMVTTGWQREEPLRKPKIVSRGFPKFEPQHTATRPPLKRTYARAQEQDDLDV